MAISWKTKKAALRAAIAKALKLDRADTAVELADGTFKNTKLEAVQWENEPAASRGTQDVWVDLRLGSVVPISQDEVRYDFDADTDRLLPTYGGHRRFSVTVIIGTDSQVDYEAVGDIASRLRTRLRRPDVLAGLWEADIGFSYFGQTINADYMDEGRMYSQSITELFFETNEVDEPEEDDTGDYVAAVEGLGYAEYETGDEHRAVPIDVDTR